MEFLFKRWDETPINRHKNNVKKKIKKEEIKEPVGEISSNTENIINEENIGITNPEIIDNQENLFNSTIKNTLKIENHVKNVSYELIDLVKKIEELPCKIENKNTIISKGDFNSPIMIIGESPNEDDNLTFQPLNGDKKQLINKMFDSINIDNDKIYTTYMFFWDTEDKVIGKKDLHMVLPLLHEHILMQKPKLIITLGSTVAKSLLKLEGIMKYRGTFQELNIEDNIYPVFITYSPSYIIKMNKYKEYEEDFLNIKKFLNDNSIVLI